MCPQYFYRLRIMCFYRGDRETIFISFIFVELILLMALRVN